MHHRFTRTHVALLALMFGACSTSNQPTSNTTTEHSEDTVALRREALTNIADNIIITQYADFSAKTSALTQATKAWNDAPDNAEKRAEAQQAWREAMASWQHAEVFQLGPAGIMTEVAGGEDLRDLIYSWPLSNACRVDQELAKNEFMQDGFFEAQLINIRGLDSLEYTLFYAEPENSCAPTSTVNSSGSWATIDNITERRASFSYALAQDIEKQAKTLEEHWTSADRDFRAEFVNAGTSSETYSTTQEALNALSDAMFYLEKETKDMKLAIPAGLSKCAETTCPEAIEHPYADFALEASLANHKAFQKLYVGNAPGEEEARGFDDLLIDLGQDELDAEIKRLLEEAIAAHEAVEGTFSEALAANPQQIIDVYDASQAVGRVLKTQFVSILDLEVPQRAEGDND